MQATSAVVWINPDLNLILIFFSFVVHRRHLRDEKRSVRVALLRHRRGPSYYHWSLRPWYPMEASFYFSFFHLSVSSRKCLSCGGRSRREEVPDGTAAEERLPGNKHSSSLKLIALILITEAS